MLSSKEEGCSTPAFPNLPGFLTQAHIFHLIQGQEFHTFPEVRVDVCHLVAICCHADGGVAIAKTAGAASGVVGL